MSTDPLPSIEALTASDLARRMNWLAADLRKWADRIDRAATEVKGIHATPQRIARPYAHLVQESLSGELQSLMHMVVSLGSTAADVEVCRAESRTTEQED